MTPTPLIRRIIPLVCLAALLLAAAQGCTVYKVAVDPRTTAQVARDERITLEIESEFLADETVEYLDFSSSSYLGHVYITGEYEAQSQVDRAVQIARGVDGVRAVTTYLLPERDVADCSTAKSVRIKQELATKLFTDSEIYGSNVDIRVVQCVIVLTGLVDTQAEIDKAVATARSIEGNRGVKSYLRVY